MYIYLPDDEWQNYISGCVCDLVRVMCVYEYKIFCRYFAISKNHRASSELFLAIKCFAHFYLNF